MEVFRARDLAAANVRCAREATKQTTAEQTVDDETDADESKKHIADGRHDISRVRVRVLVRYCIGLASWGGAERIREMGGGGGGGFFAELNSLPSRRLQVLCAFPLT